MKSNAIKSSLLVLLILFVSNASFAQFEQKFTFQAAGGYVQALQPEFFSDVFNNGFSLDAGAQYNFSRSFSIVALAKYSTYFAKDEGFVLGDIEYNLIGISLCPKFKFFTGSRLNPYLYGGGSLNYYTFKLPGMDFPWEMKLGFSGGVGFDFRLNDNIGLFLQGGLNGVNGSDEMFLALYSQIGINISMFKSKTL